MYAVLGPAHYLTEISWLHDRGLLHHREIRPRVPDRGQRPRHALRRRPRSGRAAGGGDRGSRWWRLPPRSCSRWCGAHGAARSGSPARSWSPSFWRRSRAVESVFRIFLPTLIHVSIFTGAFILIGALARQESVGAALVAGVPGGARRLPLRRFPGGSTTPCRATCRSAYGYLKNDGTFTDGFIGLNHQLLTIFNLHDFGQPTADIAGFVRGVNAYLYGHPLALAVMAFIAFAYTYHYLNWFSKTSIIRWHEIPRARSVAVVLVWLASVALFVYDYRLGLQWLFFLSFTHVALEFPLNHLTFVGIGREIGGLLRGEKPRVARTRAGPTSEGDAASAAPIVARRPPGRRHVDSQRFESHSEIAGMTKPSTVGELRQTGYAPRSVKAEIRQNLIRKLERGERIFPGIVGFDETVLPQVENALLSGQDLILLGERGQAKSRLARSLVALLDETVPTLAGSEINDDPLQPISKAGRALVAELGDRAPIEWLPRERRYGEKLATPDITIADLIGEVDPDQGRRGPLPRRRADDPLRAAAADAPRHLRVERAARPRGAHPGGPPQHHGGAGRPDPRLPGAPAARPARRRLGEPRGLHEPRAHHHAAQGPLRVAGPDPLPPDARPTRSPSSSRRPRASPPTAIRSRCPRTCRRSSRS